MKKYAAAAYLAVAFFVTTPVFASTNPFIDVPLNHWSHDAIGQLTAKGIISGYPDGTYKGKQPTTRYEMASTVARALALVDTSKASRQDVEMLKKLVVEFKDELDALGVKIDSFDGRFTKLENRLGGWKLGGSIRFDLYSVGYGQNDLDDESGAAFARSRLEINRWFGEDDGMHLYIRINDGQDAYTKSSNIQFNKFYVEFPAWWDSTLTVGRFLVDNESKYYLDGETNFSENIGFGLDAWLTDRTMEGLGWSRSFGLGRVNAYVSRSSINPGVYGHDVDASFWELGLHAALQFTEQWGFDVGGQYFLGDDQTKVSLGNSLTCDFDNLWTAYAGLRFNFSNNVELKGQYFYQNADYSMNGRAVDDFTADRRSAFRAIVDVKQDLLKFTSLWLEYDSLEKGFVLPNEGALVLGGTDSGSLTGRRGSGVPSVITDDLSIWRAGAKQSWNDKWSTFLYVSNYSFDGAGGDTMNYALGVIYRYNPNVQFGLAYSAFDSDDNLHFPDPQVLRFRTFVSF
ncbi:MAG: S-layer homology domain-containing protein [Synergistaceae bacterium]|jgi:hypothetical protein|nr:S-layer homology domain-containing protein [Synergistaceae bacterium]